MTDSISFFGLGKLGLPLAALFARSGLSTLGLDTDAALIARLKAGETPYVEPGLTKLLAEAAPALTFDADAGRAATTNVSIILVPTPSDGVSPEFSTEYLTKACNDLAAVLKGRKSQPYHLIVISSTVPPGTLGNKITPIFEDAFGAHAGKGFGIVYIPDFVALGRVIQDFRRPPYVLIGSDDPVAAANARKLYQRIVGPKTPIRVLSTRDAEIAKMTHNVFLCVKISFGNFLAQLGDRLGGIDLDGISDTLSLDLRIGSGLTRAGAPYGGTCLPRDTAALRHLAGINGLDAPLARAADDINAAQFDLIERALLANDPRSVAVLGLSFKPGTPVTVGSPAFELIARLIRRSVKVFAYDPIPEARNQTSAAFGALVTCCETAAAAWTYADAILVANPERSFVALGTCIPPDRIIVDPWGCIEHPHPRLLRPGRSPLYAKTPNLTPVKEPTSVESK